MFFSKKRKEEKRILDEYAHLTEEEREQKEFYDEIAEDIESGNYFRDVNEFYSDIYTSITSERSYLMLFAIISIICMLIVGNLAFKSVADLNKTMFVYVDIEDSVKFSPSIESLTDSTDNDLAANYSVHGAYLKLFIKAFEEYNHKRNFELLKTNRKMIEDYTSDDILVKYDELIDVRNPNSYKLKYRTKIKREIEIVPYSYQLIDNNIYEDKSILDIAIEAASTSYEYEEVQKRAYTAYMDFDAIEISQTKKVTVRYRATIDYIATDIKYDESIKRFVPFEFKVTKYEVKQIAGGN